MKQSLISAASALFLIICSNAWTDEGEGNEPTVITDNFKVVPGSTVSGGTDSAPDVKKDNVLGILGNKKVVVGTRNPHHLAYVKNTDNGSYIIKDTILVRCAKGTECIPPGLSAVRLSRNIYEVTVKTYDEWKSVQEELRSTHGVINVAPSYEHGITPSLK